MPIDACADVRINRPQNAHADMGVQMRLCFFMGPQRPYQSMAWGKKRMRHAGDATSVAAGSAPPCGLARAGVACVKRNIVSLNARAHAAHVPVRMRMYRRVRMRSNCMCASSLAPSKR